MTDDSNEASGPGQASALPATVSAEQLAELAATRPDLRDEISNHPNCYDSLRQWIAQCRIEQTTAGAVISEQYVAEQANHDPGSTGPNAPKGRNKPRRPKSARTAARAQGVDPRRAKRLRIGAVALLSSGLLGGVFVAGWFSASHVITAGLSSTDPVTVEVPVLDPLAGESQMPDVRGLDEETARQVIADAGLGVAEIEIETRPAAGVVGVVIEQKPAFGTEKPTQVKLVLSTEAAVPDLIGTKVQQAEADLAVLGAAVTRVEAYDPSVEVGTVLQAEPGSGEALPELVTLTVNATPAAKFLADVSQTEHNCSSEENMLVGGEKHDSALECGADQDERRAAWLLAGGVDRVTGSIGISDEAAVGSAAAVTVLLDGKPVQSYALAWGAPQQLDLHTSGALKLEFIFSTSGREDVRVILGGVKLLGTSEGIARLETSS